MRKGGVDVLLEQIEKANDIKKIKQREAAGAAHRKSGSF